MSASADGSCPRQIHAAPTVSRDGVGSP